MEGHPTHSFDHLTRAYLIHVTPRSWHASIQRDYTIRQKRLKAIYCVNDSIENDFKWFFFFLSTRKFRNFRCARQKVRFTVEQKKTALFPCDQLNYSVKNKPSTINTFIIRNHCFYCSSSCRYDTNRCCCCSFFISNTKSHSLTCINMSKNASLLWLLLLNFTIFACLSSVKWKLCAVSFHFTDSKKKIIGQ